MTTVASTTSSAATAAAASGNYSNPKSVLGKDEFLKLLVAQMKNQDPMNPSNSDQMAAQLAQFSSLEQLQNINSTLDTQTTNSSGLIDSIQTSAALGTVGKTVVANSDGVDVPAGADATSISVHATIPTGGGKATLKILDSTGKVIGTRDLGAVTAGAYDTTLGSAGEGLGAGSYHYAIDVTDSSGTVRSAGTSIIGVVSAVQATSTGPMLKIGNQYVPFSMVTEIRA